MLYEKRHHINHQKFDPFIQLLVIELKNINCFVVDSYVLHDLVCSSPLFCPSYYDHGLYSIGYFIVIGTKGGPSLYIWLVAPTKYEDNSFLPSNFVGVVNDRVTTMN